MATVNETVQWLFDNCSAISIDRSPIVATTTTKENVYQSIKRDTLVTKFTVTPSPGLYNNFRPYLARLEQIDRVQVANINFTADVWDNIFGALGNPLWISLQTSSFTAYEISGQTNQIILAGAPLVPSPAGDDYLRSEPGDWITLADIITGLPGPPYQVIASEYGGYSSDTIVTLDRDLDAVFVPGWSDTSAYIGNAAGQPLKFDVICTERPSWSLQSGASSPIVTWNGNFVFYQDIT